MPVIDLTRYIVAATGTWTDPTKDQNLFDFTLADTRSPDRLMLRWAGDFVALTGPLRVRVTVQAENLTLPLAFVSNLIPNATAKTGASLYETALARLGKGGLTLQAGTIYTYSLDISAGQAWPFNLTEQLDALRLQNARTSPFEQLGNNLGYRVIIEPAFLVANCTPVTPGNDLPCDYAVVNQPNTASFFPVACEPCTGTVVGLPPGPPTLITPPADGGCVRTRFFNGMFITREDLETEQRYHRLKSRLHNRASGAGVVWGFGVGKTGDSVWVRPGYGVDCCGNDVTLTGNYQVEIAALLADPAAASLVHQRGPQRLSLLLEYVECPSDPRPVHGDPCSPDISRCEMSRIRESVRLRLVPPCDYNPAKASAPLQNFLDDVRKLRAQFPIGQNAVGTVPDRAPFQLRVTFNNDASTTVMARPAVGTSNLPLKLNKLVNSVTVEAVMDPLWTFMHGSLAGEANAISGSTQGGVTVDPKDPVDLSLASGFTSANRPVTFTLGSTAKSAQLVFKLSQWQAQTFFAGQDDLAPGGDLVFTIGVTAGKLASNSVVSQMTVSPLPLAAAPCTGQPCATSSFTTGGINTLGTFATAANAFGVGDPTPVLPWLHTDPVHPGSAGDPKALILAALGGWLAEMLVREQAGTAGQTTTVRREVAQAIYRLAWLLLFGVSQKADQAALGASIQTLLEGLCDAFLWTGPHCCCEPHGVVIGCAVVSGGTIQKIDPFGGRRYVVHYPLLEHWGAQFGIAPLDITLTRLFSRICCLASLPAPGAAAPNVSAGLIQLGSGFLAVGDPADIAGKLEGKTIVAQRRVSTAEMIGSALTLIGKSSSTTTGAAPTFTALILAGVVPDQAVILLMPE